MDWCSDTKRKQVQSPLSFPPTQTSCDTSVNPPPPTPPHLPAKSDSDDKSPTAPTRPTAADDPDPLDAPPPLPPNIAGVVAPVVVKKPAAPVVAPVSQDGGVKDKHGDGSSKKDMTRPKQ